MRLLVTVQDLPDALVTFVEEMTGGEVTIICGTGAELHVRVVVQGGKARFISGVASVIRSEGIQPGDMGYFCWTGFRVFWPSNIWC